MVGYCSTIDVAIDDDDCSSEMERMRLWGKPFVADHAFFSLGFEVLPLLLCGDENRL